MYFQELGRQFQLKDETGSETEIAFDDRQFIKNKTRTRWRQTQIYRLKKAHSRGSLGSCLGIASLPDTKNQNCTSASGLKIDCIRPATRLKIETDSSGVW
jgi:hypothetical protein